MSEGVKREEMRQRSQNVADVDVDPLVFLTRHAECPLMHVVAVAAYSLMVLCEQDESVVTAAAGEGREAGCGPKMEAAAMRQSVLGRDVSVLMKAAKDLASICVSMISFKSLRGCDLPVRTDLANSLRSVRSSRR